MISQAVKKHRSAIVNLLRTQTRLTGSSSYPAQWTTLATKELGGKSPDTLVWKSPEGIDVKPLYTQHDVDASKDVNSCEAPGVYPFKRGPYATMYTAKP